MSKLKVLVSSLIFNIIHLQLTNTFDILQVLTLFTRVHRISKSKIKNNNMLNYVINVKLIYFIQRVTFLHNS